ncbi:hypothetical protein ACWPKO_25500 (plasmid) [Coraliomargarita sp. W4R53]
MSRGSNERFAGARVLAIAAVVILAVVVVILAALAMKQARPESSPPPAAPVPTFSVGIEEETATPTPTVEPAIEFDRADERFLAVGAGFLWRGVAGACGESDPLIERSGDDGATWVDVTPFYKDIAQIASLDPFSDVQAEAVAGMGDDCDTQALRTFTQGEYWQSYPDVLTGLRYVDLTDPAVVIVSGQEVAAPCDEAHGLRASGDVVVLLCDGSAYAFSDGGWAPLFENDAVAIALVDNGIAIAHMSADCDGVAVTLSTDAGEGDEIGCAEGVDAASPLALAATSANTFVLWSDDELVTVGS